VQTVDVGLALLVHFIFALFSLFLCLQKGIACFFRLFICENLICFLDFNESLWTLVALFLVGMVPKTRKKV
jgi:hypothetical protein